MVDTHYRAFVSYSHADRETGEKLHRKLESYRVPAKLVGKLTAEGSVPRRLTPIFRDREDLPTSGDLSASVETALKRSRFLIVLCSPAAAASEWVDKEVRRFKTLHGEGRILGVILDAPETESVTASERLFPPSLRFHLDDNGELTGQPAEPLAADLRETGDGAKYGFLKIVAGLIGVGLDDLVQRDQSRRNTEMKVLAGASGAIALAMAGLTWLAVDARNEARMQQREAEGLVEFMLTDLKEKLEAVGRLDALDSTGERLLDYYAAQDADRLDADSLGRRARAQLLVGDIDQRRNDLDAALAAYEAAAATTQELLSRQPNNANRIFEHAQSVFWVGYIAHQRRDMETASAKLDEYLTLAQSLVEKDADNPKWRMEYAYALGNLGAVEFAENNWAEAIAYFDQSTNAWRALRDDAPTESKYLTEYAYMLSWLALAKMQQGLFAEAIAAIDEQLGAYRSILEKQPDDIQVLDPMAIAMRRLAQCNLARGDSDAAHEAALEAKRLSDRLLERDQENAYWKLDAARTEILNSDLHALSGESDQEIAAAARAVELAKSVAKMDDTDSSTRNALGRALARRILANGAPEPLAQAARDLQTLFDRTAPAAVPDLDIVGEGGLALSAYYAATGQAERADDIKRNALNILQRRESELSALARFAAWQLCAAPQQANDCAVFSAPLREAGFRHPRFAASPESNG